MSELTARHHDPGVLPGVRDAVRTLLMVDEGTTWQLPDGDVSEGLAFLGQARQLLEVAEVALVREGIRRGLPAEHSWSPTDWVAAAEGRRAPRPSARQAASTVRVANAGLRQIRSGADASASSPEGSDDVEPTGIPAVLAAVDEGVLSVGKADQLVRFEEDTRRVADPGMLGADLGLLLEAARDEVVRTGPEGRVSARVPGLDEKKLASAITQATRMLKPARDLAEQDDRQRRSRSLTQYVDRCGMTRYRLTLDPEGAAIVDAAVAAMSKPDTDDDGGPDPRTPAHRRADAILTIVGRGVSAPEGVPQTDKAQVLVTISLAALTALGDGICAACGQPRPGAAFGVAAGGITATGQVLAPAIVRKMACAAGIVPVMLGTESEPLELGRATRYFTPGQRRLLVLRDGGCTYPGCTMPAQWTDAHHLTHWSRGGHTDIANAALLCERHHTHVHVPDLTATARGVTWHV